MIYWETIRKKAFNSIQSDKFVSYFTFIFTLLVSVFIAFVIAKKGFLLGSVIFALILGSGVLLVCLLNIQYGLLIIVFLSFFIFTLIRLRPDIPFGVGNDIIIIVSFFGIFLQRKKFSTGVLKSPIVIVLLAWTVYQLLQAFNPNAVTLQGWLFGIRGFLIGFLFVMVAMHAFYSKINVIFFTKFWLALALFTALYALKQEYIGLFEFEKVWVYSNPKVLGLSMVGGRFRRWSILGDVSSFGMFMAFSGLVCFVLSLGPFRDWKRIVLFGSGCIMFYAMVFSFTRTAYAMVPIGFLLYFLMNINNKKVLIFSLIVAAIGLVLLFGPFYNGPLNRIRSTFHPQEDASYEVRENNRALIQPYMYEHPMGGGPQSTGFPGERFHPGHTLAGFPPDNFYLRTALEYGWIGLLLFFSIYSTVMILGIRGYYRVYDPSLKILYAAYLTPLFALSIANFVQVAHGQPPMAFIVGSIYALMYRLKEFDNKST